MSFHSRIARALGYHLRRLEKSDALEGHVRRFFANHAVGLVLDCGAFVGKFGLICRNAGYRGSILSFEPAQEQFAVLTERTREDQHWEALQIGVGVERETKVLRTYSKRKSFNSIYQPRNEISRQFSGLEEAATESIEIHRLDEILDSRNVPKDTAIFLKSDTQGNDLNVIRGMGERMGQVSGILVEMSVQPVYHDTPSHWQMLDFMREAGFQPYGFSSISRDRSGRLIEYDALFGRA